MLLYQVMDHNNHNVDAKTSQARQKRRLCVKKNKKSVSLKDSTNTPLSDITYSSLNRNITSHTNVPNLPIKQNVSTSTSHSGFESRNLCENIQPTTSKTTQKLNTKRNADHLLSVTNISNNKKIATQNHVQTTSTRFLHDHSNTVKSQPTIRAILESSSKSKETNQTHSSNIPYNKFNAACRSKRNIPGINLLNKFSETDHIDSNYAPTTSKLNAKDIDYATKEKVNNVKVHKKTKTPSESIHAPETCTKRNATFLDNSTTVRVNNKTKTPSAAKVIDAGTKVNNVTVNNKTKTPSESVHAPIIITKRNATYVDDATNVRVNKKTKTASEFATSSKPVQSKHNANASTDNIPLQPTNRNKHTSPTIISDDQTSALPETIENPTCERTNKPTNISTDVDYFNKMFTNQSNTNQQNENRNDDASSDSDDSDDTQSSNSTDEEIEDIDENILGGNF
jgi:hypothetical protein